MSDALPQDRLSIVPADPAWTPAGLQTRAELSRRRAIAAALNLGTLALFGWWLAAILGQGGWNGFDIAMFAGFMLAAPWWVMGLWNAVIGLWFLRGGRKGRLAVSPFLAAADEPVPLTVRTAVLMTIRNEDPERAMRRIAAVHASLEATGEGAAFDYFVLSDTQDEAVGAAEEEAVRTLRAATGLGPRLFYRRREVNTGFKAGNIRDFLERWGGDYELMLTLDADSLMSGETILRMARVMQRHPRIGILQSLVVGLPSKSAFARLFQFGMRHGMRSYTMGAAWWAGDCGPYWGHNGIIRVKPFRDECDLPLLPGRPPLGGHILSHDQIEAVFMRRAGYEVRVDPHECGSWEENPPTLPDFSGRDLRWCQGNMQYWKLMRLPDILPMSRFQLVWAILLYLSTPAFMIFTFAFAGQAAFGDGFTHAPAGLSAGLFAAFLVTALAPKLAGLLDVALTPGGVARYGGPARFTLGALAEITFYQLLYAITSFRVSVFMAGLLFGKSIRWNGQARDARGLTWAVAWSHVWPQTLAGLAVFASLAYGAPATIPYALVWAGGLLFAAPFAVVTASPRVSAWFVRTRFCGIPEEFDTPPEVAALSRATASGRDVPCAA